MAVFFSHLAPHHLGSQLISLNADVNKPKGKAELGLTSCQLTQEIIRYTFPICHFAAPHPGKDSGNISKQ